MGGAPTISGGMTYEEQKKLLDDENAAAEAREQKARDQAKQDELDREERARLDRERIKAEELSRITEANLAEEEAIKASESMQMQEETDTGKVKVDFYKNLYTGMGSARTPQSNTQTNRPL